MRFSRIGPPPVVLVFVLFATDKNSRYHWGFHLRFLFFLFFSLS
jgi:hypothetical protein